MSRWEDWTAKQQQAIPDERCRELRILVLGTDTALTTIGAWDAVDAHHGTVKRHLTGECRCDHDAPPLRRRPDGTWHSPGR